MFYYPAVPANVQHRIWLGSARAASVGPKPAAASGGSRAAGERQGADPADTQRVFIYYQRQ